MPKSNHRFAGTTTSWLITALAAPPPPSLTAHPVSTGAAAFAASTTRRPASPAATSTVVPLTAIPWMNPGSGSPPRSTGAADANQSLTLSTVPLPEYTMLPATATACVGL